MSSENRETEVRRKLEGPGKNLWETIDKAYCQTPMVTGREKRNVKKKTDQAVYVKNYVTTRLTKESGIQKKKERKFYVTRRNRAALSTTRVGEIEAKAPKRCFM